MAHRYRNPAYAITTAVLILGFVFPAELAGEADIVRLGRECRQGHNRACEDLLKLAKTSKDSTVRVSAVSEISDQSALARIANTDVSASVRRAAVVRLTDQDALRSVATGDKDSDVRSEAVRKLKDAAAAAQIARSDPSAMVRQAALELIEDVTLLKEIAASDPDLSIRRAAARKIADAAGGTNAKAAPAGRDNAAEANTKKLTVDEVIKLKKLGIADDLVIGQIQKLAPGYDISTDDLIALKSAGVSDEVVRAMVARSKQPVGGGEGSKEGNEPGADPPPAPFGDYPRVVYLPAIDYGPNQWSAVKIVNAGTERMPVRLEAYRADGSKHPATTDLVAEPQQEMEIRVEGTKSGYAEPRTSAWVRVIYPDQGQELKVTCNMEFLEAEDRNTLHTIPRRPEALENPPKTIWFYQMQGLRGKILYLLNVADEEATVRVCQGDDPAALCPSSALEYHIKGRASLERPALEGLQNRFLIVQTEQESRIFVMFMTPSSGEVSRFLTDTSISFDK